ncbi:ankyrin repeat-containing domain protein [Hypoxylon crocopeplum]|nr:ankyrin repeat-containing domain protein [Hypoxylon crocopeplum]
MLDNIGATPVYLAAQSDHFETVQYFLELDKDGAKEGLLHLAVSKDSDELLNIVFAFEPDLNWTDETGNSALHFAIQEHNIPMIKALHEKGASTCMTDEEGHTPLYLAVADQDLHIDTIRTLLDLEDADLKVDDPCNGVTPFLELCRRFTLEFEPEAIIKVATLLLKRFPPEPPSGGININIQHPETGRTPLHYASDTELDDLTFLLLKYGANPSKPNNRGSTPILLAAEMGKVKSVEALIDKGADPQHASHSGVTALHRAAYNNHPDCVRFLLDKGADPNYANEWGYTPVGLAASNGYVECVQEFLKHQKEKPRVVDLTIKNTDGLCILGQAAEEHEDDVIEVLLGVMEEKEVRLALLNAVVSGHSEALRVLLAETKDNGAYKLDDERYGSLLGAAVAKQKGNVFDILLKTKGIQVDKADKDGRTPLMYAVMLEDDVLVERLLEAGARPNLRDAGNETPLSYAIKEGSLEIIKTLIEADGAEPEQKDARGHNLLYWDCRFRDHGEIFDLINDAVRKSPEYVRLCELAIHGAVASNSQGSLSRLLSVKGIDVNARDNDGWTPLQIAKCCSSRRLEEMLTKAGAKADHDPLESKIPTGWHLTDKACGLSVEEMSVNVVKVTHPSYNVADEESDEPTHAIARANHCFPDNQDWYFEVNISAPEHLDDTNTTPSFGIGICEDNIELVGMLGYGWPDESLSFGYHGDDGDVYPNFPLRREMSDSQYFSSADSSVGCGFNYEESAIYFTRNGEYLGTAFNNVPGAKLYPAIFTSTSQVGMEFSVRFDSAGWQFDPKAPRQLVVGTFDDSDDEGGVYHTEEEDTE